MDSKLIALERALLTVQQEIAKYKSDVPKEKVVPQKTLGLKRSKTIVVCPAAKKQKPEEEEDTLPLSEGDD